ncbi:MAG: long-chain fatty acid--CoA ligase [Chloroflexota bacterium]
MSYHDKPWLKKYDPDIPHTLEPYPCHPLYQFLRNTAQSSPDAVATVTSAHLPVVGRQKAEVTYRDLDSQTDALATALVDLGVKKGDRVAIVMPNCVQFIIAFYAILKAGGIVCATNPTYPAGKMQNQLKDCGATIAITLSLFYNTIKQVQKDTDVKQVVVTNIKEYLPSLAASLFTLAKENKDGHRIQRLPEDHDFQELLKRYAGRTPNVDVQPADLAIFQYTGGTTGGPKAAMASHQALVCNVLQSKSWLVKDDRQGVILAAIPLFHVFGMVAVMSYAVATASQLLIVTNARDTTEVLEVIDTYKPTLFDGVPAMYNAINNHPGVIAGKYKLDSIIVCVSGSAPLPPGTKRKFEELSGCKLVEGYGMSEMPTATHINPVYGENRGGSIGLPLPDMEARIVSLDDGETELAVGEIGELVLWGPQIMVGYHDLPTETNHALRPDANGKKWLYTGDIARMDEDGYFYIVDRKKDMAIIGGFNVYPNMVERVLSEHPAIHEVSVAAIPHPNPEKAGQDCLKAWVVLKPDQQATEQELIDFSAKQLARYEVPTRIEFVAALPKSSVGKVLRRELIQMEKATTEKIAG